ncbi:MAG: hypothetical protein ABW136_07900, partial [Steroidobacteraceae bacterium]
MRGYLGNQGRNRSNNNNKGGGQRHGRDGNRGGGGGGGGNANGNIGGRPDEIYDPEPFVPGDDSEISSPEELAQSRKSMNLTELKAKPIHEL